MKEIEYKKLYNAIYDALPEYMIDVESATERWSGVDTTFGPGIALNVNGFEHESMKLACANSFYNRGYNNYLPFDIHYTDGIDFSGKTVGVVGNMKGIKKRYGGICSHIYTFDLEDKECLSIEKEDEILPQCDIVAITGSSIQNGTLPHVLSLCENAFTILTGPSVPQCIELLNFNIDMLAGMCVSDRDMMFDFIKNNTKGSPYTFGIPFRIRK